MHVKVKIPALVLVAVMILLFLSAPVQAAVRLYPGPADAGFFGGDSDYDFDPPSWGGSGDSSYDFPGSSFVGGSGGFPLGGIIVIIVIVYLVLKSRKGSTSSGGSPSSKHITTSIISPQQSQAVADQIRLVDPFFTEAEMREKVANLYSEMQRAWETQDWEPMRVRMTDDLYSQMARQLQDLISRGQINRIERIAIMNVALKHFYQDEQYDNLTLRLTSRITDYTIDRASGKLVSGDPKKEKFLTYEWTMIRTAGTKTTAVGMEDGKAVSHNCPHCGAPIDLTQSARCSYCFSIVTAPEFDWVLSNIKGIAQQTL